MPVEELTTDAAERPSFADRQIAVARAAGCRRCARGRGRGRWMRWYHCRAGSRVHAAPVSASAQAWTADGDGASRPTTTIRDTSRKRRGRTPRRGAAIRRCVAADRWPRRGARARRRPAGRDERDCHPDSIAEAFRRRITVLELQQIIGRGRGLWRTADNPLHVLVLTDVPLDMPVEELTTDAAERPSFEDRQIAGRRHRLRVRGTRGEGQRNLRRRGLRGGCSPARARRPSVLPDSDCRWRWTCCALDLRISLLNCR